jgi:lysophospholipase L1-like esterase
MPRIEITERTGHVVFTGIRAQGPPETGLLTQGVTGEPAASAYLQVRSGGSQYSHNVSGNWTLEYWIVPPSTITAEEGTFSSREIVNSTNLILSNFRNSVATTGFYDINIQQYNSAAGAIVGWPLPIPYAASNTNVNKIHIVLTCSTDTNYTYRLYVNGCHTNMNYFNVGSTQSYMRFQYLTDRVFAGRFGDAALLGTRFYDRCLSFSEVVQSYNGGNWSAPIGSNLVFDFRMNLRSGNDFLDNGGSALTLTGVNFTNIANNIYTPVADASRIRIVCDGDSITFGSGSTAGGLKTYPYQLLSGLASNTYEGPFNLGISGQTAAQLVASYPNLGALAYQSGRTKNIYVAWAGTNDLYFGASAATAYNSYASWCALARATGYKVVAVTILPRSNSGTPGSFEADRQTFNTSVRNNYTTFADALADVAANTTIGDAGDQTNVTYYFDLCHMTDAGYAIVAGIVKTAVLSV